MPRKAANSPNPNPPPPSELSASSAGSPIDEPTFERALQDLEQIVRELEDGHLGLNEALKRYEEGIRLLRRCQGLLEGAQRKIEILSGVDAQGNPISRPFDHVASLERDAQEHTESSLPPDAPESSPPL